MTSNAHGGGRRGKGRKDSKGEAAAALMIARPSYRAMIKGPDAPDTGNRPNTPILESVTYAGPKRVRGVGLYIGICPEDPFELETHASIAVQRLVGGTGTRGLGGMF